MSRAPRNRYGKTKNPTALKHFSSGALNSHFAAIANRHSSLTATDIQEILQIQPPPEVTARLIFQNIGANDISRALSRATAMVWAVYPLPCLKFQPQY